jgi:hypothetical protein
LLRDILSLFRFRSGNKHLRLPVSSKQLVPSKPKDGLR